MGKIKFLEFLNLLGSGVLAGGEFMVCAGLMRPIAALEQIPHIKLRQALVRRLRVLTPIVFLLAASTGLAVTILEPKDSPSLVPRILGEGALIFFISLALFGTVPINKDALNWSPTNPPEHWILSIGRWERLDIFRCLLAIIAFSCFSFAVIAGH